MRPPLSNQYTLTGPKDGHYWRESILTLLVCFYISSSSGSPFAADHPTLWEDSSHEGHQAIAINITNVITYDW